MGTPPEYIIFTDASVRRNGKRSYCGFGVAILNVKTLQYTSFGAELGGRTVSFGEAWAIYRGVQKIVEILPDTRTKKNPAQILVVTDSKLSVKVMSEYIPFTWDVSDWNNWKKVDGSPVKNQDLYRRIVDLIKDHPEIHFRIAHINSHKNDKEWELIQMKLNDYGIKADKKTVQLFMKMNSLADEIAQTITARMRDEEIQNGEFIRLIRRGEKE